VINLPQTLEKLQFSIKTLRPHPLRVVVMPDLFLDRLVSWNSNREKFSIQTKMVANRKGGSIDNIAQMDLPGGNAINTAFALASLGIDTYPIICTSKFGQKLLEIYSEHFKIDLSHIKLSKKASITTALEFENENGKSNVMLRDVGSLKHFSLKDFSKDDYKLLKDADYVCIFNWAGTQLHGTEIAQDIFTFVKTKGTGKTYYDTADPLPNKQKIPELLEKVICQENLVDIISLNENEAITYTSYLAPRRFTQLRKETKSILELAGKCIEILSQHITSRIDLHATDFSATYSRDTTTYAPTLKTKPLRATGAGDAWNAGNIFADAHNFPEDMRLTFANSVAAFYLQSSAAEHPTLKKLQTFIDNIIHES
jgi:ribokinase